MPKISVIMPTYNGEQYVEETLASINAQHLPVDELVISDDGSDDQTLNIIQQFSDSAECDVVVLHHKRNGVTANYLNALKSATGDLILISDQDDVWLPDKTHSVVQAFNDERVQLVCHDCLLVDHKLESTGSTLRGTHIDSLEMTRRINNSNNGENLCQFLVGGLPLLAHSLSFRSKITPLLLSKPPGIPEWWFEEWVSCIATTTGRLHFLPDQLVLYRQHDKQTSGGISGSKKRKSTATNSNDNKYSLRIQKMRYCAELIKNDEQRQDRYRLLMEYINFLQCRQNVLRTKGLQFWISYFKLLFRGTYHRFSNGFKSAVLDLIIHFK